ncbi:MAG: nitroreductase family protein, partial [Fulvivirga sp.]|nr:nitroreductase family protein [Fulvivirga sp.]
MEKKADTKYPIHEIIANRWSPRAFKDDIPKDETLIKLLEAARWAPSSFNEQPSRCVLGVKGKVDSYDKIYQCLKEINQ